MVKTVKVSEIIVPDKFIQSVPSDEKVQKVQQYIEHHQKIGRAHV